MPLRQAPQLRPAGAIMRVTPRSGAGRPAMSGFIIGNYIILAVLLILIAVLVITGLAAVFSDDENRNGEPDDRNSPGRSS